jgi:hypothetical protein
MNRTSEIMWLSFVLCVLVVLGGVKLSRAQEVQVSGKLSPSDYLLGSQGDHQDPVFDKYRTIELDAKLGVGSDCGRVDFKSTLKASLSNVLDAKYFGDMGKDILGASPMLLTCYFSPTWCAILKHSQISAHYLSQMRLDQCSLIDKYTDSRTEDFYQERQACVRRSIDSNGGNLEQAMESCRGSSVYAADLTNWAGSKNGEKSSSNRLIESSAQWAGMNGPESRTTLDLLKSMVGDTIVSRGSVSVEYGPRSMPITPRTYLQSLETATHEKLCRNVVKRVLEANGKTSLDVLVTDDDLRAISPGTERPLVDRQTIRALAYMSPKQRDYACQKLSDAIAMTTFSRDINRSLDVLTTLSQNPNLPPQRKQELEQKRRALKEQIEVTLALQHQKNDPLNSVLSQVNETGSQLQNAAVGATLQSDAGIDSNRRARMKLMDCTDGIMCGEER